VTKLHNEITGVVNLPEVRKTFVEQGNEPLALGPAEFGKIMAEDAEKWGAIGRKLGVELE